MIRTTPHRVTIWRQAGGGVDEYGDPLPATWQPVGTVAGLYGVLDATEAAIDVWQTNQVTASARVPLTTDVKATDRVDVTGPGTEPGQLVVTAQRRNRDHLRLMLGTVTGT